MGGCANVTPRLIWCNAKAISEDQVPRLGAGLYSGRQTVGAQRRVLFQLITYVCGLYLGPEPVLPANNLNNPSHR